MKKPEWIALQKRSNASPHTARYMRENQAIADEVKKCDQTLVVRKATDEERKRFNIGVNTRETYLQRRRRIG